MALRSLDNTPPTQLERPKKAAKITGFAGKSPDFRSNDENVPPPGTDPVVDYIASEELKALADPEAKIQGLLERLESKEWLKLCEALNDTRRLTLYHSSSLVPILDKVIPVFVKAMKNPRSALCKTSIMASTDLFHAFGPLVLSSSSVSLAFEQLLLQLLLKASQDKRFVCEEAERALQAMAASMPPLPLLQKLQAYVNHANLRVRAKAAVSMCNCVSKMDSEGIKEFGWVPLLCIAAGLLNDRLPEARDAARSVVNSIYSAFSQDHEQQQTMGSLSQDHEQQQTTGSSLLESWQSFCSSNLSPISTLAVMKLIPQ